MKYDDLKKEIFEERPAVKEEYDRLGPQYQMIEAVIAARVAKGLTQKQLAEMIGTKQSSVSRLENGTGNPSLAFLQKVAEALGLELVVGFREVS